MLNTLFSLLILSMDFETGYVPNNASLVYRLPQEYYYSVHDRSYFVSMSPRVQFKFLYADFDFTYFASPSKKTQNFCPYRGVWGGEIGLTYKYLTIGYANNCSHKITPQTFQTGPNTTIDGHYDKFFLRVSFSNK